MIHIIVIKTGENQYWKGFNKAGFPRAGTGLKDAVRYNSIDAAQKDCAKIPIMVGIGEPVEVEEQENEQTH